VAEDSGRKVRSVHLFSGGLDSILSAEVLRRRAGVEVILLRHYSVFYPPSARSGYMPPCTIIERDITAEMVALVKDPAYGYGSHANPCLDCKEMMYRKAWEEARRQGADFVSTGEVLGQRPMSQHEGAFKRMEKGAGVEGLVVRPLSGKLLPPTIPERKGLLHRKDLLDIQGRSRRGQLDLARRWGIEEFPSPAGGCKLTDPQYGSRVLSLSRGGLMTAENCRAARHGRFVELGDAAIALVGRNHEDNRLLIEDAPDGAVMFELKERPGPVACLIGDAADETQAEVRRLVIQYSRFDGLPLSAVGVFTVSDLRARWAEREAGGTNG
jgi:tRNA U34 2-thiouridine synthase MnmA/TrmU